MKITILGRYGPYPPPGGNCSGYLLQAGKTAVLLDCGNGCFSRLQEHIPFWELDGILLSHLHMDHVSDCFIARYAMDTAITLGKRKEPLKIYTLTKPYEIYSMLQYKDAVWPVPVNADQQITIGEIKFSFISTLHSIPCLSLKAEHRGKKFVYSGDTEFFEDLIYFVRKADLFLCESNYLSRDLKLNRKNHLASFQAARIGAEGQVRKLKLTHLHPECSEEEILSEAREYYRDAELAEEGEIITL